MYNLVSTIQMDNTTGSPTAPPPPPRVNTLPSARASLQHSAFPSLPAFPAFYPPSSPSSSQAQVYIPGLDAHAPPPTSPIILSHSPASHLRFDASTLQLHSPSHSSRPSPSLGPVITRQGSIRVTETRYTPIPTNSQRPPLSPPRLESYIIPTAPPSAKSPPRHVGLSVRPLGFAPAPAEPTPRFHTSPAGTAPSSPSSPPLTFVHVPSDPHRPRTFAVPPSPPAPVPPPRRRDASQRNPHTPRVIETIPVHREGNASPFLCQKATPRGSISSASATGTLSGTADRGGYFTPRNVTDLQVLGP